MKIKIELLSKDYRINENVVHALRGVNLSIKQGDFCAIVGPSGSGKTTLFNLLGCIDQPTAGKIFFDKNNIDTLSKKEIVGLRRNQLGYIFQFFNLIPSLTAFENAELPFWYVSSSEKKEYRKNLIRLFDEMEIVALKDRYPRHLSGGQEQRVAIARALANKPKLVLADEPTGNLDSETSNKILELMKNERKKLNATFIVSTHDLSLLEHFDKIIYLKDGQIEKMEEK